MSKHEKTSTSHQPECVKVKVTGNHQSFKLVILTRYYPKCMSYHSLKKLITIAFLITDVNLYHCILLKPTWAHKYEFKVCSLWCCSYSLEKQFISHQIYQMQGAETFYSHLGDYQKAESLHELHPCFCRCTWAAPEPWDLSRPFYQDGKACEGDSVP